MTGKTAFVTGATGFVGENLVEALVAQGWSVTALHRRSSDTRFLSGLGVELVEGDVTDPGSIERGLPEGVDAVFHLVGDLNMWSRRNARQTQINVGGTRNMIAAARSKGARRFVNTSSVSAWATHHGTISERSPSLAPSSTVNYERSKWEADEAVRQASAGDLDGVIVSPCAIVGPRDRSGWARLFFQLRDGAVKALPPGSVPINHIREVVKAHINAAERGRRGETYLLPGPVTPFADLLQTMADLMGMELNLKLAPPLMLKLIARVSAAVATVTGKEPEITPELAKLMCGSLRVETDKAERELGYSQVPMREAVQDSYDWLVAEGLL